MTKITHEKKPSGKHKKKHKTTGDSGPKIKNSILVLITILILAAIPFGLGKYFEFNFPDPYDSGAYVYSAKHILDGAKIGIEEKPSAKLATLLVNMLGVSLFGYSEAGPELIQTMLQTLALVLMFIAIKKLSAPPPAAVAVIIAAFYLSAPAIAKFGNVKEQYMIACMAIGISCFVLSQLGKNWGWAVLAGAFLSWAPLFKETGTSAIGAVGLFIIAQPFLKHKTWKQTGADILLLVAGAAIAIVPLYIWIIGWDVQISPPYSFAWKTIAKILPSAGNSEQLKTTAGYIAQSKSLVPFSQQWPRVLRFYSLLILPITLAAGSIILRITKMFRSKSGNSSPARHKGISKQYTQYDRFVLLFAVWWLLDMAFIWISPRSYVQYYLPLNASAAMLGGYIVSLYCNKLNNTLYKGKWIATGVVGIVCMIAMSWHIFFGVEKSPHTGAKYNHRSLGYSQRWAAISNRRKNNMKMPWEILGQYVRNNSETTDSIYVWGWYPGIYVAAQRFSSSAKACMLPRQTPDKLKNTIAELLDEFEQQPPKFIIDSRKRHIPTERPPYELWPIVPKGFMGAVKTRFLSLNQNEIARYDAMWSSMLNKNFGEDEALRYEIIKPFRELVMKNYKIVRLFGQHVLFERKTTPTK